MCFLRLRTTERQNHRVAEVGRDLWKLICSNPPSQAGPPRDRTLSGELLSISNKKDSTTSLGNSRTLFVTVTVKLFPDVDL